MGSGMRHRPVGRSKKNVLLNPTKRRITSGQTNCSFKEKTSEIRFRRKENQKISDPRCRPRTGCLGEEFGKAGARRCRCRSEAKISQNKNIEVDAIIPLASALLGRSMAWRVDSSEDAVWYCELHELLVRNGHTLRTGFDDMRPLRLHHEPFF